MQRERLLRRMFPKKAVKMIKAVDIDKLFDKYIEKYVYENIGKIKPEEIEDSMPVMFNRFGGEKTAELGGKSPREYYLGHTAEELLACLKEHIETGVPVSDFLCEAITGDGQNAPALSAALYGEENEEFTAYLMNMLSDMGAEIPVARYMEFALEDYPENIGELATEALASAAERSAAVRDAAVAAYEGAAEAVKARLAEILSHAKGDKRAFSVLTAEFSAHPENVPLYAGYLARFGDERALPLLYEAIEREGLTYADFEELRFAIEALGGSYDKERDFSADRTYKKIKGASRRRRQNR